MLRFSLGYWSNYASCPAGGNTLHGACPGLVPCPEFIPASSPFTLIPYPVTLIRKEWSHWLIYKNKNESPLRLSSDSKKPALCRLWHCRCNVVHVQNRDLKGDSHQRVPPTPWKGGRVENCRHLSQTHCCLPGCQCTDHECNDIRASYSTEACTETRKETIGTSDGLHWAIVYQVLLNNNAVRGLCVQELLYFSHFDISSVEQTLLRTLQLYTFICNRTCGALEQNRSKY